MKHLIITLMLLCTASVFSQKSLYSVEKTVCTWDEDINDFTNCEYARTSVRFLFNKDFTVLKTTGDIEITFYLGKGKVNGELLSFESVTHDYQNCTVYVDSRSNTVKFLFTENDVIVLVTYML